MFVYVSNGESNEIKAFSMEDVSAKLMPIGSWRVQGVSGPMAISPDRRYLHVAIRTQPWTLCSFAISAASGELRPLSTVPLTENTCYISVDKTGRYLFQAAYHGSLVATNAIGPGGMVQIPPVQVIATPANAHCILPDPANRHVLVACLGGGQVLQFNFDENTGLLSPNNPAAVLALNGAGPRHFRFHPDGRHVYVLHEHLAFVTAYWYDPGAGTLTELQRIELMPADELGERVWFADLQITPDGRFLYTTERGTSTITIVSIDRESRRLAIVGRTVTEKQPRGIAIHPYGNWLMAVGQLSNAMSIYEIDQETGLLDKRQGIAMGRSPHWIEIVDL